jgi:proteic killer suppression protein
MIKSIEDKTTQDIFDGLNSKEARKFPQQLHISARRKLDALNAAKTLEDMKVPPGNKLEALSGDLAGKHSIRINDQWRIVFKWIDGDAHEVQICDYH